MGQPGITARRVTTGHRQCPLRWITPTLSRPSKRKLYREGCEEEPKDLLGDEHPTLVEGAAVVVGPAEHDDVEREHDRHQSDGEREVADRCGLRGHRHERNDAGRVEEVPDG